MMPATLSQGFLADQPVAKGTEPRKVIIERLRELGKNRYWLVQQLNGNPSLNAIYSYLRGDSDMGGENLAKVFRVLGIELHARAPKRNKKGG